MDEYCLKNNVTKTAIQKYYNWIQCKLSYWETVLVNVMAFYDSYQNVITDGLDKYDPLIHRQLMEFIFFQRIPVTQDLPELMFNPKLLKHLEGKSISHVPVSTTEIRL